MVVRALLGKGEEKRKREGRGARRLSTGLDGAELRRGREASGRWERSGRLAALLAGGRLEEGDGADRWAPPGGEREGREVGWGFWAGSDGRTGLAGEKRRGGWDERWARLRGGREKKEVFFYNSNSFE